MSIQRFLTNIAYKQRASIMSAHSTCACTIANSRLSHFASLFHNHNPSINITARSFSGHNRWSKIRHKKGANDKKKAALMGKASRAITAAAKDCGGDMSNLRLQSAISHAKSVQLAKDRVEEAISKAMAKATSDQDFASLRFDAMMNFDNTKIACVITALSDNRNRTTQQVRHLVSKHGGELLPTDNLAYVFEHVGWVIISNVTDEDALFECALEAGASNVEQDDDDNELEDNSPNSFVVTTEEKDLFHVVTALREAGYNISHFEHRYILQDQEHGGVEVSPEGEEALLDFLEKMDETDDVNDVYHNAV
jgi:YebC/PmpR family DNA-binding regulatory protein